MNIPELLVRFVHIVSAVVLVGGLFFLVIGVLPVLKRQEGQEEPLRAIRKRFFRLAHPAIVLLILSGGWQWWQNHPHYEQAPVLLRALLHTKLLLAMIAFALAFAAPTGVLPGCPGRWAKVNLCLGLVILILASAIRTVHVGMLDAPAAVPMP